MPSRFFLPLVAVWGTLIGLAPMAHAHDPSLSGIRLLTRRTDTVVVVLTHLSRLAQADGRDKATMTPDDMDRAVRRRLHLRFQGKEFVPREAHVIGDQANDLLSWQTVFAGTGTDWEVGSRLYPEDAASRTVVTMIQGGQMVQETLLDSAHPNMLTSQPAPTPMGTARRYLEQGVLHILTGWDHICFVLGLLLLGGTVKSLLRTVTAFTAAHSLTLTLAATGIVTPSARLVEPLIALSIVTIAAENIRLRRRAGLSGAKRDARPLYAFGFGLIHGFGFAGALAEVGLSRVPLGIALTAFNVGVEVGQAAIILGVSPLLSWLASERPKVFHPIPVFGSVAIGAAGLFWFVTRIVAA